VWCPCGSRPFDGAAPAAEDIPFRVTTKAARVAAGVDSAPCDKGCTRKDGSIEMDAEWWRGLDRARRLAVLAHEHGHASGIDCEGCCDRHGGFLMRSWGYSIEGIKAAYDGVVTKGDRLGAGDRACEGARAYDSTTQVDGAGIDGVVSAKTATATKAAITRAPTATKIAGPASQRAVPAPVAGGKVVSPPAPARPRPFLRARRRATPEARRRTSERLRRS
jgi:hypothetical protein